MRHPPSRKCTDAHSFLFVFQWYEDSLRLWWFTIHHQKSMDNNISIAAYDPISIRKLDLQFQNTFDKMMKKIDLLLSLTLGKILDADTATDELRNLNCVDLSLDRKIEQRKGYDIVFDDGCEDTLIDDQNTIYSIDGGQTEIDSIICGRQKIVHALQNLMSKLIPNVLHDDLIEAETFPGKRMAMLYGGKALFAASDCVHRFD